MYYVRNWHTDEKITQFKELKKAKKFCRVLGHTGEDIPILTGFPPVAYVSNEAGEVVYNPRFKKAAK